MQQRSFYRFYQVFASFSKFGRVISAFAEIVVPVQDDRARDESILDRVIESPQPGATRFDPAGLFEPIFRAVGDRRKVTWPDPYGSTPSRTLCPL
jgi:hypothetical protein